MERAKAWSNRSTTVTFFAGDTLTIPCISATHAKELQRNTRVRTLGGTRADSTIEKQLATNAADLPPTRKASSVGDECLDRGVGVDPSEPP